MHAILKMTLPSLYPEDYPDRHETMTVRDDDAKYREWVDGYNDVREKELGEKGKNCCKSIGVPIRFDYSNPLMMLMYLSPGHGIHLNLSIQIHSVSIETTTKTKPRA